MVDGVTGMERWKSMGKFVKRIEKCGKDGATEERLLKKSVAENLNQISTEEESDAPCCGCEWLDCDNEVKTKL